MKNQVLWPLIHYKSKIAAAAKSLQLCPTLCDPIDGNPPGYPHPWDSPGKNTGVACHFLLQCTKVKSESEVTQLCLTLHDLIDCCLPGSSVHGIFQARVLEWGAIAFSDMLLVSYTHSSVLAWRIPGTAEPGALPSMGSHRVGHNWGDLAAAARSYKHNVDRS